MAVKLTNLARTNTVAMANDPDLTAALAAGTSYIVEISLLVTLAQNHGGLRWNLVVPVNATADYVHNFVPLRADGYLDPMLSLPDMDANLAGSEANYLHFNPRGAWTGRLYGELFLRTGTGTGQTLAIHWGQFVARAGNTTMRRGSLLRVTANP